MSKQASLEATPTVSVLVIVDAMGALSTQNLGANVYMVDTNKYLGSGAEGQAELVTTLPAGARVYWSIVPVDPFTNVTIFNFTGQAITQGQIAPVSTPDGSWTSLFQPQQAASGTQFQYSMGVQFNAGPVLVFDPFLQVK